jgi:hypothetical protein
VPSVAPKPVPAAVLVATAGARWADGQADLRPGQPLPAGAIDLTAGFAEVRLKSGATFIVQGPARFEVRPDAMALELTVGKLTATVPTEARGFTVRTESATVIDYGTEFGVEAGVDKSTRVEVFRGEVEAKAARPPGATDPGRRLTRQQAAEVTPEAAAVVLVPPTPAEDVARTFVRDLATARLALPLANTGAAAAREGEDDPNWQYVAGPEGPLAEPRPAVVFPTVAGRYGASARAKWISAEQGPRSFPVGAFTFRTGVNFAGFNPATAAVVANVLVDNYVKDVRVNGKSTGVSIASNRENTIAERRITIPAAAFTAGVNQIEFVVFNEGMTSKDGMTDKQPSPMAFQVEWNATAAPDITR